MEVPCGKQRGKKDENRGKTKRENRHTNIQTNKTYYLAEKIWWKLMKRVRFKKMY